MCPYLETTTVPATCIEPESNFKCLILIISIHVISRPRRSQGLLYKHLRHWFIDSLSHSSFVKISLRHRHTQMVGDGAFSHKINVLQFSKSRRASKSHYRIKSYSDFAESVDFAYWWSFSDGGSAIKRATPSSLLTYRRETGSSLFDNAQKKAGLSLLADPGKARGCSTNTLLIH